MAPFLSRLINFSANITSCSRNPSTSTSSKESSPVNVPHLPDELLLNCLSRVSRSDYPTLSLVSKKFRSLLASTELYQTRKLLGITESCFYVCILFPDSSKPHCFSYKPRWFTLSHGPTRVPRRFPSWFSSRRTRRTQTNHTRKLMISVPSPDLSTQLELNTATIGSSIYIIGGSLWEASSRVLVMDCWSHTWHEAPSMQVAKKEPLVSVLDGKIYVVERSHDCDPWNFMEFFDPKTQIWEHAPSPSAEIHGRIHGSFAKEGNLYLTGTGVNMVYKPKENKWDAAGWEMGFSEVSDVSCKIDNVQYYYFAGSYQCLQWHDSKTGSYRAVKGLEKLPILPKYYRSIKLMNYGRMIVIFWEVNIRAIGSAKKKMIWGAEIEIERPDGQEVCGKVKWCDVVLTVPESCRFDQLVLATV